MPSAWGYGNFLVREGLKEQSLVDMTDGGNDRRGGIGYLFQNVDGIKGLDACTAAPYHCKGVKAAPVNGLDVCGKSGGIAEGLLLLCEIDIRGSCLQPCPEITCGYGRAGKDKEDFRTVALEKYVLKDGIDVLKAILVFSKADFLPFKVFLGYELVLDYLYTGNV